MAGGSSDIRAGGAYVELLMRDKSFSKGLDAAQKKLRGLGRGMSIAGAAMVAVGSVVTAPLLAMVREFTAAGDAIGEMSQRTGQSVTAIQELQFAADRTGASIEIVEKAILAAAKSGKNFDKLAAQVAAIDDPAKQLQKSIEVFGKKAGPYLLPMLRDLPALRAEFRKLGLGLSKEETDAAGALDDAFLNLRDTLANTRQIIGAALAPAIMAATKAITNIAATVRNWVRENRELFAAALKIGVVVSGVGVAVTALGGVLAATGFAIAGFNALLGVAASAAAFLVSPIGLVIAGLAALATWFATSTEWGRQFVQGLVGWFGNLLSVARETFGGIADAIAAGDLALAAKVAWAGLKLAWLEGTNYLRETWVAMTAGLVKAWFITTAGVQQLWNATSSALSRTWSHVITFLGTAWDGFLGNFKRAWNAAIAFFQTTWLRIKGLFGADVEEEIARINAAVDEANSKISRDTGIAQQRRIDEGAAERDASRQSQQAELDRIGASLNANLIGADTVAQEKIAAAQAELANAKQELSALRGKAAQERADKELAKGPEFKAPGEIGVPGKIKSEVFGTFSAAALSASGAGIAEPMVREQREANRILHLQLREAQYARASMKQLEAAMRLQ